MKETRNKIKNVLDKNGVQANYKLMKNMKPPCAVFFMYYNENISSSNIAYAKHPMYQISYFSKKIEDTLLESIRNDLLENNFICDAWQEGESDETATDIYHYYLEVEYIV